RGLRRPGPRGGSRGGIKHGHNERQRRRDRPRSSPRLYRSEADRDNPPRDGPPSNEIRHGDGVHRWAPGRRRNFREVELAWRQRLRFQKPKAAHFSSKNARRRKFSRPKTSPPSIARSRKPPKNSSTKKSCRTSTISVTPSTRSPRQ